MPRVTLTEQQQREKALALAVARARVELGLTKDRDLYEYLDMSQSQFSKRKKDLYRSFGFELVAGLARRLHFTGEELCEICGVPYAADNERRPL